MHNNAVASSSGEDVVLAQDALTPKLVPQSALVVFANHPRFEGGKLVAVDLEAVDAISGSILSFAEGVDPEFTVSRGVVGYTVKHKTVLTAPLPLTGP